MFYGSWDFFGSSSFRKIFFRNDVFSKSAETLLKKFGFVVSDCGEFFADFVPWEYSELFNRLLFLDL
ncbi:hypothetical protein DLM75_18455 [Leptospira stimsonii]|uniref:Uncharacterized protein n=1 Tax=Leptospira stimsonii TaxID=2202203 RepID=A0A396Z009_9LEPT|nr:hypothetical protein DLM75_18455 [Leptospira stimsonii]